MGRTQVFEGFSKFRSCVTSVEKWHTCSLLLWHSRSCVLWMCSRRTYFKPPLQYWHFNFVHVKICCVTYLKNGNQGFGFNTVMTHLLPLHCLCVNFCVVTKWLSFHTLNLSALVLPFSFLFPELKRALKGMRFPREIILKRTAVITKRSCCGEINSVYKSFDHTLYSCCCVGFFVV